MTNTDIYKAFHDKVKSYIVGKVYNKQDVEDLVSQVFLKIYEKINTFDDSKASLSTWIYTITRNTVTDYIRKVAKTKCVSFDALEVENSSFALEEDIDFNLLNEEMLESLATALENMDECSRDIIILHYNNNISLKEIANMLNMSYSNTKIKHQKTLHKLRIQLQN